jgi:hypothetical protein
MEYNYLILVNYYNGDINVIKFTKKEKEEMLEYSDFQDYIYEILEERYGFDINENYWSVQESYNFIRHNF